MISLPKNWGWISKTGVGFFLVFWSSPGRAHVKPFQTALPGELLYPLDRQTFTPVLLRERLHIAISLSPSLSVHSTTCHELGVVGGHKKPEESNRRVCISSEIKFLFAPKTPRSMRDLWKGNIYSHYYVAGEVPETFDLERALNHHRCKFNSRQ
jgi:hypothetical protein